MILHEEFERCKACDKGWFRIEKRVLIQKDSPFDNPMHYREKDAYICMHCEFVQYEKANGGT